MLIHQDHLDGIALGAITLAFRRWRTPSAKTGGSQRTAIGVLAIDEVRTVREDDISEADAQAAGFSSRGELLRELANKPEGEIYRIRLHPAGPDPRIELRDATTISEVELEAIRRKLRRLDERSANGAWTHATLDFIARHPALRAVDVAKKLGFEKVWLKIQIRKLKELGLTESLEVGYRLSPRGRVVLEGLD